MKYSLDLKQKEVSARVWELSFLLLAEHYGVQKRHLTWDKTSVSAWLLESAAGVMH